MSLISSATKYYDGAGYRNEVREFDIPEELSSNASMGTKLSQSRILTILTSQSDFPRPFNVGTCAFVCPLTKLPPR